MSTFALEVRFTGVCHFLPKGGWELDDGKRKPVTALIPDAGRHDAGWSDKDALDGRALTRHVAFASFDLRHLAGFSAGAPSAAAEAVWYIHGHKVTFEGLGETPSGVRWEYSKELDNEPELTVDDFGAAPESMVWLAPLSRVAKDYYQIDEDHACARVELDSGGLTPEVDDRVEWKFKKYLSGTKWRRPLAHEIVWRTEGLEAKSIRMKGTPIEGGDPIHVDLVPRGGAIRLKFRCFDERNPLGWRESLIEPVDDEDFRWHYQLLAQSKMDQIKDKLKILGYLRKLPIPEAYSPKTGAHFSGKIPNPRNIQGVNCIPGR